MSSRYFRYVQSSLTTMLVFHCNMRISKRRRILRRLRLPALLCVHCNQVFRYNGEIQRHITRTLSSGYSTVAAAWVYSRRRAVQGTSYVRKQCQKWFQHGRERVRRTIWRSSSSHFDRRPLVPQMNSSVEGGLPSLNITPYAEEITHTPTSGLPFSFSEGRNNIMTIPLISNNFYFISPRGKFDVSYLDTVPSTSKALSRLPLLTRCEILLHLNGSAKTRMVPENSERKNIFCDIKPPSLPSVWKRESKLNTKALDAVLLQSIHKNKQNKRLKEVNVTSLPDLREKEINIMPERVCYSSLLHLGNISAKTEKVSSLPNLCKGESHINVYENVLVKPNGGQFSSDSIATDLLSQNTNSFRVRTNSLLNFCQEERDILASNVSSHLLLRECGSSPLIFSAGNRTSSQLVFSDECFSSSESNCNSFSWSECSISMYSCIVPFGTGNSRLTNLSDSLDLFTSTDDVTSTYLSAMDTSEDSFDNELTMATF